MPSMCLSRESLRVNTGNTSHFLNETYNGTFVNRTSMKEYPEYQVGIVLVKYAWPFIIFTGTIGNALSFLVLIRRRMRRTSVYFYLAMLACADTCALYLSGFKTWLRVLTGFELLHISNGSCKVLMFLFLQSLHLSAIFIVTVSLDRFLTIWFTFKNAHVNIVKRSGRISLIAFCCLLLYNCHVFWTIGLQETHTKRPICAPYAENTFMCEIFPWLKLSLYTVVPFLIVFILNFAISIKMFSVLYSLRTQEGATQDATLQAKRGQFRVTVMLLAVSMSWLLLTAPFTLFIFVSEGNVSTKEAAKRFLLKTICFTLLYINHSVNFFLYCVTGRRFRKEFRELVCSYRHRGRLYAKRHSAVFVRNGDCRQEENRADLHLQRLRAQ